MNLHFDELTDKVTEFLKSEASTDTIVGKEFKLGDYSCVPVIKLAMGFGSGGGEGHDKKNTTEGEGAGAGAGVSIEPIGFLVASGKDISFLEAGKSHGLAAAIEKVPDLMEKYMESRDKKEAEEAAV